MSNPLRERIRSGKVCAGVLTSMPSTNMAQTLSNSGFDWLFIDMEHGAIDIASLQYDNCNFGNYVLASRSRNGTFNSLYKTSS